MRPSAGPPPLSRIARLLLTLAGLGDRRPEVESDLAELRAERTTSCGRVHATRRLYADIASLVLRPRNMGSVVADLRYGARLFRRHPALIGATVTGLALAIGVCTSVFTILNAAVMRPYGMDDPTTVVRVQLLFGPGSSTSWPYSAFVRLREEATSATLEATYADRVRFTERPGDEPQREDDLLFVSGTYLQTLGGRAVIGRSLEPSDDRAGAAPVVVLNHTFWQKRFNGDPGVIGRTIWLSGSAATVIGVIESSFTGPDDTPPSFWAPLAEYAAVNSDRPLDVTSTLGVNLIARVATGVGRAAAQAELSAIAASIPGVSLGHGSAPVKVSGVQLDGASSPIDGPDAAAMALVVAIVLLTVGLVLALACANVTNLLLAGASAREREIGVRLAMGATRGRIIRQLISESCLIAAVAGVLGFVAATWTVPLLAVAMDLPATSDPRPDWTVALFTTLVALLSGVGAGLAPARFGASGDVAGALKSQAQQTASSPKTARLSRWFIGFQAAASIVLLVVAALFTRAALHITHIDLGFDADKLLSVSASLPARSFDTAATQAYWRSAADRVRALAGIDGAALILYPPFSGSVSMSVRNRDGGAYTIFTSHTSAEYFGVAGFRIVRGRTYTPDEVAGQAPVAVVSQSLVRDFFGDADPIGASLAVITPSPAGVTIIGVAAEAYTWRARGSGGGTIYRPIEPKTLQDARLMVRTTAPGAAAHKVESAMRAIDPRVRLHSTVMANDVERFRREPRILAALTIAAAAMALVLAVLGLHGVTAFVVSQRTREMSLRLAIGASAADILRLLIGDSLRPVGAGLAIGLIVALSVSWVLTDMLSGISAHDPVSIVSAVAVLTAAVLFAVIWPARRAAKTDPALMLREQ